MLLEQADMEVIFCMRWVASDHGANGEMLLQVQVALLEEGREEGEVRPPRGTRCSIFVY